MKDYKKILEGVVDIINTTEKSDIGFANICSYIGENCPELKESEDERIRKAIIDYFDDANKADENPLRSYGIHIDKAINWLEKQGTSYTKKDVDDAYLEGVTNTKNEIEKQYEADYQIRKDIATFIFNYRGGIKDRAKWMDYLGIKVSFVEKQGEQKPVNKVEPKFNVGDWVATSYGKVNRIASVDKDGDGYTLDDGVYFSGSWCDRYHPWTIQDAKDGDVLCYKDEISLYKLDIKNCTKQGTTFGGFVYYCCYDGERFITDNLYSLTEADKYDIHPATKEQRDTLIKAMADAGYTFDFEKKELKKIEQKSNDKVESFDKYEGLTDFERTLADICIGWIGEELGWKQYIKDKADVLLKIAIKKFNSVQDAPFEQKPTWSEEDSPYYDDICEILINLLHSETANVNKDAIQKDLDWLKSLKERVQSQPQNKWKESLATADLENSLCDIQNAFSDTSYEYRILDEAIEFIRCTEPKPQWKPSDEQMEALENVRKILHTNKDIYSKANNLMYNFEELIRTLKKLKS